MKNMMWLLLALLILAGGFLVIKKSDGKEIVLNENQVLVKVNSIEDKRFTGEIIKGGDQIAYNDEITFTFDTNESVSQLKVGEEVVLELPELPIMTNSIPPQMPRTKIVK